MMKSREALARVRKESEEKMEQLREVDAALSDPPVARHDMEWLVES